MGGFDIISILKTLPAIVIGLTIHEFSHAYVAYRLGDSTAKDDGRVTLNPIKHIDPLGFILIIIAGFGWAKPVMFNPDNLKKKHRDEILISLAGPFSNLLLAILLFVIARMLFSFSFFHEPGTGLEIVKIILISGILNLGLFIFNLLPLPPLDGSHLYLTYLKRMSEKLVAQIYKYGTIALLVIIVIDSRSKTPILPIKSGIDFLADIFFSVLQFK